MTPRQITIYDWSTRACKGSTEADPSIIKWSQADLVIGCLAPLVLCVRDRDEHLRGAG
jgi:hypothetical protein